MRASARRDDGHALMPLVLAVLAVLAGALAWLFASAGLARQRSSAGSGWSELLPALVAGCVAALLAVLAVVACVVRRRQAATAGAIAQDPARPWLRVPQWSRGRIQDAPATQAAAALGAFASVWTAVVIGAALLARERVDLRSSAPVLALLGLFGLAGVALFAVAIRLAIAARRFGRAALELSGVPGVLGGWLRGAILLPPEVPPGREARVCLACRRDSTGSSRLGYDVWQAEAAVTTAAVVPVAFRIPFNLPASDLPGMPGAGTMRVSWLLSIAASLPGVDYAAVFSVPVFATGESDPTFVTVESRAERGVL